MKIQIFLVLGLILCANHIDGAALISKADNTKQTAALKDAYWAYQRAVTKTKKDPAQILKYANDMRSALASGADANLIIEFLEFPSLGSSILKVNESLLDTAIYFSDVFLANLILEYKPRANAHDQATGDTPLIKAVKALRNASKPTDPQFQIVKLLIKYLNANYQSLNVQGAQGMTPLMLALEGVNIVPASIGSTDSEEFKELKAAKVKIVKELIKDIADKHQDLNISNQFGFTPLIMAAIDNEPDIVALLLERGASPKISHQAAQWLANNPLSADMEQLLNTAQQERGLEKKQIAAKSEKEAKQESPKATASSRPAASPTQQTEEEFEQDEPTAKGVGIRKRKA